MPPQNSQTWQKATMMDRDETERRPFVTTRLPPDVKAWLEREAARNGASQNSEIIRSLRIRMDTEPPRKAG
jgi:hypothetical protein